MILQCLTNYYEALAAKGKVARLGWAAAKVSFALEIGDQGEIIAVFPLKETADNGKKPAPRLMELPAAVKRTVGISSNFLWDNASYILGIDGKGKPERAVKCFQAAKDLHVSLLAGIDTPEAKAIVEFFNNWDPARAADEPKLAAYRDELDAGGNLVFMYRGQHVSEYRSLCAAWQTYYGAEEEGGKLRCLVTGEEAVPAAVHPSVKNVRGAQSSGAALVSFNAPAFCSFDREQSLNAPVSKYAAFAYTTALNHLLADREHTKLIGDTTVVYWAEDAESRYQDAFSFILDGEEDEVNDRDLDALLKNLASGKPVEFDGFPIEPSNHFYILGLAPNAARLSVRFFLRDSFAGFVRHIKRYYDEIDIVADHRNTWLKMPLWALLRETVNLKATDKSASPQMAGDMFRTMLTGARYPETLLYQTFLRIRAEHEVTRGRAAIVKAYLLRNAKNIESYPQIEEVSTVALNSDSTYTPYVLGRLFSVLEVVQQNANPGINATIKDRFFNSACATPSAVFPILMKLANSHLRKLETGSNVYWSKQIGELTDKLAEGFPKSLSLQEQGAFILGYYHQTQKRFEKKN